MATNDGTTTQKASGGDVIADEAIQPGSPLAGDNQSIVAYKIMRTKVAVGPIDRELGDATNEVPLPVGDRAVALILADVLNELRVMNALLMEKL